MLVIYLPTLGFAPLLAKLALKGGVNKVFLDISKKYGKSVGELHVPRNFKYASGDEKLKHTTF